jgi:hypothetical protein
MLVIVARSGGVQVLQLQRRMGDIGLLPNEFLERCLQCFGINRQSHIHYDMCFERPAMLIDCPQVNIKNGATRAW